MIKLPLNSNINWELKYKLPYLLNNLSLTKEDTFFLRYIGGELYVNQILEPCKIQLRVLDLKIGYFNARYGFMKPEPVLAGQEFCISFCKDLLTIGLIENQKYIDIRRYSVSGDFYDFFFFEAKELRKEKRNEFILRLNQGNLLSKVEIADFVGCSETTVRRVIKEQINQLKEELI